MLAAATLIATGTPSGAVGHDRGVVPAPGPAGGVGAEADVSYHGHVSLWDGRVGVWLESANHGPAAVSGATVRLRFSVALAPGATLPPSCSRTAPSLVQCGTGPMRAAGTGAQFALDVPVVGTPAQVTVGIDTAWNGGLSDRNPANDTHRVLVLATGDPYTF
ncbi:hypothetical protein ACFYMW_17745 [Streptomyces sp. NPDC006692]|uniref:hypothetical protein n=1 Tax=Streptomyces sp. NPDC006692 TaxID=3364758 RepID=UPI0036A0E0AE